MQNLWASTFSALLCGVVVAALSMGNQVSANEEEGTSQPPPRTETSTAATGDCAPLLDGNAQAQPVAATTKGSRKTTRTKRNANTAATHVADTTTLSAPAPVVAKASYTLESFMNFDDSNLALRHPFTVANAAEKMYALLTHMPARDAVDPLYRVKRIKVHPMIAGEHPAAGGRMVVGQEESIHPFVQFIGSIARGDRTGKAIGFPGPVGTGKTELLYVVSNIERNLGKEDKYKQLSYRFHNLHTIPYLRNMFRFSKDGEPTLKFIDPDMPRSPFTLLREDMQDRVLAEMLPRIREKFNMVVSKGWKSAEPKSQRILQAIFEHEIPEIASGEKTVDDLSEAQYLDILNKYVVIVPQTLLKPKSVAQMIRAQTDNPNWQALFAAANLGRAAHYGYDNPLAIDYRGQIFQQDGGLLMFDELYRNPPELLNVNLEIVQNHIAQTDYGQPVLLDVVPVWNANDESIEKAREDQALRASLDRAEKNPMRSLLVPNQIEAVALFQVEVNRFKMRDLNTNEIVPVDFTKVFPAVDALGKTETAYGRYALYYDNILIAPLTLNYMAWLTSASRFVTDQAKLMEHKDELNLITANPALFTNAITRLRITLGELTVEPAEKMELSRLRDLLREGEGGITSRDVETWIKTALNDAVETNSKVLTPRMLDMALHKLLDRGTIAPANKGTRADWQLLRSRVKLDMLLPKLDRDVKAIISGDAQKSERIYDELEREFIETANNENATHVIPDDGSQPIPINHDRLREIRQLYRQKWGRDFSPNFLLRQLRGARQGNGQGNGQRDGQLLEVVREHIAKHDSMTADYISAFDSLYKGENNDPEVTEKAGQVSSRLHRYGYDEQSFREAVAFVAQLRNEKNQPRKP